MRITQGTFSYLPDLTADEIRGQIQYAIDRGWAVAVEFTDDPHPRNVLWERWGLPMFELSDASAAAREVTACVQAWPDHYVRVSAYDASLGRQTTALSFIVNRPVHEPGFTWTGRTQVTGASATRCTLTPPTSRAASATATRTDSAAAHERIRHASPGGLGAWSPGASGSRRPPGRSGRRAGRRRHGPRARPQPGGAPGRCTR